MNPEAIARAKARITEMQQEAERITQAVNLPEEATYTVMSIIFDFKKSCTGENPSETDLIACVQTLKEKAVNLGQLLGLPSDKIAHVLYAIQDTLGALHQGESDHSLDAIEEGLSHLKQMRRKAEMFTKALGLPKEAKYHVLSAAYEIDPRLVGGSGTESLRKDVED